jgi:RimJ/RimL family protein N-acetyltransferase
MGRHLPFFMPERRALIMGESGARERKGRETEILTPRLRLRPLRKRDAAALAALSASDPVRMNLTVALLSAESGARTFVVARLGEQTLIGAGGFRPMAGRPAAVEFAVCIAEAEWGSGYGTEATQALVDVAFADPQVGEVWASIRVTNVRARRVYEKCGFQPRGTGMARLSATAGAFPVEHIVLNRRAWISLKAWGANHDHHDGHRHRASA